MIDVLGARKYFVLVDQGWSEWDLEVHGGIWSRGRIKVCTENHGGERRVLRVKCALNPSKVAQGVVVGGAVLAGLGLHLGLPALIAAGVATCAVVGAALVREAMALGHTLYDALQAGARRGVGARLSVLRGPPRWGALWVGARWPTSSAGSPPICGRTAGPSCRLCC